MGAAVVATAAAQSLQPARQAGTSAVTEVAAAAAVAIATALVAVAAAVVASGTGLRCPGRSWIRLTALVRRLAKWQT